MTKVAILAEPSGNGTTYRAIGGQKQSSGATPGQAFDALAAQLPKDETGTMVIVQQLRPDQYFTASQQARLDELMTRWRAARDNGASLASDVQAELDSLIETEVQAAGTRAAALLRELER